MSPEVKDLLSDLIVQSDEGVVVIDCLSAQVEFINDSGKRLFHTNADLHGRSFNALATEFTTDEFQGCIQRAKANESFLQNYEVTVSDNGNISSKNVFDFHFIVPSKKNWCVIRFKETISTNSDSGISVSDNLEIALDKANIGLLYIDMQTRTMRWSRGQQKIHGVSTTKLQCSFETFLNFVFPDDAQDFITALNHAAKRSPHEVDYRIIRADGEVRWLHACISIRTQAKKSPSQLIAINTDISHLKEKDTRIDTLMRRENAALYAFQQREETFRLLIEKSKDCIALTNAAGQVVYITPSVISILGYSEVEMFNLTVLERIHPDDRAMLPTIFADFAEGKSITFEMRVLHKEGHYCWIESTTTNFLNTSGINAVVSNFRDITERKEAGELIIASERQLRELANAMPQLVWMAAPDGTVHYYNNRLKEYDGASETSEKNWDWSPLVHSDDFDDTREAWEKAVKTKTTYSVEHRVKMKDGTYRYHLSRAYPMFSNDDVVVQWYGTATDIHEQKEAQRVLKKYATELEAKVKERTAELRQQISLAEALIDSSLDIIAIYDKETRLLHANNRFLEHFKLMKENVIGKKLDEIFPGSVEGQERLHKAFLGESLYYTAVKSSFSDAYFTSFVVPLRNVNEEIFAALVVAHDVTEIIKTNEMLKVSANQLRQANESLIKKNQELEQFAYVASHDLQEPLRKISTFAKMLSRNVGEIPEPNGKYVEKIIQSSNRMSQLISDVLQFSQLNKNEGFIEVDLNEILQNIRTDLELLIEQKKAVIHSDPLPVIEAIPRQMGQMFYNLISNSLKFIRADADVVVKISSERTEYVTAESKVPAYRITFSDNGIGFNEVYAEKIFHMFQRLNSREEFSGSGIGLAMVKKIISTHHGEISVKSKEGIGSEFHIILPAKQPNRMTTPK